MNKKYILKKNYEIEKLVQRKNSVGNKYYAAYFIKTKEQNPSIAFSISKKIGNAVVRNYEKRVVKEIIRKEINKLSYCQCLIIIKKNSTELSFNEKESQLLYILKMIQKKNKENRNEE